jgi:hypothetical protein
VLTFPYKINSVIRDVPAQNIQPVGIFQQEYTQSVGIFQYPYTIISQWGYSSTQYSASGDMPAKIISH